MLPNTVPHDIDKYFFNRENEIRHIKKQINTIRQDLPNQILINGYKGVGKTFLVKKIINDMESDILSIYIDLSKIYGINQEITEEEILKELLNNINNYLTQDNRLNWIRERIYSFIHSMMTYKYELDETIDIFNLTIPKIKQDYSKLSKLVMELLQEIVNESSINGIILVFDEFHLIENLENPGTFLMLMRSSMKDQKNVCYIFTGRINSSDGIINIMNCYGEIGSRIPYFRIENFTRDETIRYIEEKQPNLNFTQDGYENFYECTLGIPQYINSFCNVLNENEFYNYENVNKAFLDNANQIIGFELNIWATFDSIQKEIFKLLCEYNELTLYDLIDKTEVSKKEMHIAIYPLLNRYITYKTYAATYQISFKMLELWLKHEKEIKGIYPI